jgi:hypothetical protein
VYNNIHNAPFETQADLDTAVENMKRLFFFQPPRLSDFRVSIGSAIYDDYKAYGIKCLVPSEEVVGYPDAVANRVGMLISFNAGWGFERPDDAPPVDRSRYLCTLAEWRATWRLKPKRVARRGRGFIRVDHVVGDHRYTVTIEDPLESAVFAYCQHLRRRSDLYQHFNDVRASQLDAALEGLWERHLVFRDGNECVSLVALDGIASEEPPVLAKNQVT